MFCVSHTPLNYSSTSLGFPSSSSRNNHFVKHKSGAGVNKKYKSGVVRSYDLNISSSPVSKDERRHRHVLIRSDHRLITCRYSVESVTEAKTTASRLSSRGARFIDAFFSKIVPWEETTVSFDNFPYYTDDHTKSILLECVASHLKKTDLRKYGANMKHSSNRIQLRSLPGTDLYREKLVSAVARELQVPLLKLDSSLLPPYDISQHSSTLLKVESDDDSTDEDEDKQKLCLLKKGDRVKYKGKTTSNKEVKNRTLSSGQRGEVHQVKGDKVAVIFNDCGLVRKEAEEEEEGETTAQEIVTWLDAKDVKRVDDATTHDCFIAMELLYEVLESRKPMIVYFPDTFYSILDEASCKECKEFFDKTRELIDKLSGRVVMICGQNEREAGSKEKEEFTYIEELRTTTINKIFTNVMCINPPKDEDFEMFVEQMLEDRKTVISEVNSSLMHQVLKAHRLLCTDLEQANTTDINKRLTRKEVEKIVAWATNHYISSCPLSCVMEDLLHIPHESIKLAILRLTKSMETSVTVMPKKSAKDLAGGGHEHEEQQLVSSVICAGDGDGDIGVRVHVKFDDAGVLQSVKKILDEKRIHLIIGRFCGLYILLILSFLFFSY